MIRREIYVESVIHPSALVHPDAELGAGVRIGAFSCVGQGAVLGDGCMLAEHAVVRGGSILGKRVFVDSFAVVGGDPQVAGFDLLIRSGARLEDGVAVREGATVHRSTKPGGFTVVGRNSVLMCQSHVGHDCLLGSQVTLANNVMLAGHVQVGDHCFLGGGAGVHQFVRVGEGAMIGGNAAISYDVPPFTIAASRNEVYGLNFVGIQKRRFSSEIVADLKKCYRAVYMGGGNVRALALAAEEGDLLGHSAPGHAFLSFFRGGTRGFAHSR